jgi:hypothetical protein
MNACISVVTALALSIGSTVMIGAQLIDRVLAVVGGTPITLLDVDAAMKLGTVPQPTGTDDPVQAALNVLIERQLELLEVNRYVPPEPEAPAIDTRLAEMRARFQSPSAFAAALQATGVTETQLRATVRDMLRIESYLQQRFGTNYQPGDAEMTRYYRTHEADFTRNGTLMPLESVRDDLRKLVAAERTDTLVRNWLADLRRRSEVTILPR